MITSIKYTGAGNSSVALIDDGVEWFTAYPIEGEFKEPSDAWLADGNTVAPYEKPLSEAQSEKIASINASYDVAEAAPVTLGGHEWDSGQRALVEAMSVVTAVQGGYTLPSNISWIDVLGEEVPTDASGINLLFEKISIKHYRDAHKLARLTKAVEKAETVSEVELIPNW